MAAVHQLQGSELPLLHYLKKLNLFTTDDLLFHLPRDYEDQHDHPHEPINGWA